MNPISRTTLVILGLVLQFVGARPALGGVVSSLAVSVGHETAAPGAVIKVPVKVTSFTDIVSVQFKLTWDTSVLQFQRLTDLSLNGLDEDDFSASSGHVTIAWDNPSGVGASLADGDSLFAIEFAVAGADGSSSAIVFASEPAPEITKDMNTETTEDIPEEVPFQRHSGLVTVEEPRTPPTISAIADVAANEDSPIPAISFTVDDAEQRADSLTVMAHSSNPALIPNNDASLVLAGTGASRTLEVKPVGNGFGSAEITVSVSDGEHLTEEKFTVTVSAVNDAPTLAAISDKTTPEDTPIEFPITVGDIDTPLQNLVVTVNGEALDSSPDAVRTVRLAAGPNEHGTVQVTIIVSDGQLAAQRQFTLTITPVNDAPSISAIPDQTIDEDQSTGSIAFTIEDVETSAGSLVAGVSADNAALLDQAGILLTGSGGSRTLKLTPRANASGETTVTVSVTDGVATTHKHFKLTVRPVNDAPAISAIADVSMSEDTVSSPVSFTVSDNETAAAHLTVTAATSNAGLLPVSGIMLGGSNGSRTVNFQPVADGFGTARVTLTVSDGQLQASRSFDVVVAAVNDAPVISAIADRTTNEDTADTFQFSVSDADTPLAQVTVTPASGNTALLPAPAIVLSGNGGSRSATLTPASNASGQADVTFNVADGSGGTASVTFKWTVSPVNDAPSIEPVASQTTIQDVPTSPIPIVASDIDSQNLTLTASSANLELVGATGFHFAQSAQNRTLVITPQPGKIGTAQITVQASDGELSRSTTFNLTVRSPNTAPVVTGLSAKTLLEDGFLDVTFTVSDAESAASALTATAVSSNQDIIPNSSLGVTGSGAQRTLRLTPRANQNGVLTVTVTVSDGALHTQVPFEVTVGPSDDPPFFSGFSSQTIDEDAVLRLTLNIEDVDTAASRLTVSAISSNPEVADASSFAFEGAGFTRTMVITPRANRSGSAQIMVRVADDSGSVGSSFNLTVRAVNDRPEISAVANQTMDEDTVFGPVPVVISDVETEESKLVIQVDSSNLTLVPKAAIVLTGSGANRRLTVTPAEDKDGAAVITISATDEAGLTGTRSFTLTVRGLPDAPEFVNLQKTYNVPEDFAPFEIPIQVKDGDTPLSQLVFSARTLDNQRLIPTANLSFRDDPTLGKVLVIRLGPDESGAAHVEVKVSDGAAESVQELEIVVANVDDAPVIAGPAEVSLQVSEDELLTYDLRFTDDSPVRQITVSAETQARELLPEQGITITEIPGGRRIAIRPASNQFGEGRVELAVSDAKSRSVQTLLIRVNSVNDAPVISSIPAREIDEDTSAEFAFRAEDADNPQESLRFSVASSNSGLSATFFRVIGSGPEYRLLLSPTPNFVGESTVTVTVTDGALSAASPFRLTVRNINDRPSIAPIADQTMSESTILMMFITLADLDTLPANLSVTASASAANPLLFPPGTLTVEGSGLTRLFRMLPAPNQFGDAIITLRVSDGELDAETSFLLRVEDLNAPPELSAIADQTTDEDTPTVEIPFTVRDPDSEGNVAVFGESSDRILIPDGFIVIAGTGENRTVRVTPAPNRSGSVRITLRASDGVNPLRAQSFLLTVLPVNDAPSVSAIPAQSIDQGAATGLIPFTVSDPETAAASLTVSASSSNGALVPPGAIALSGAGANRAIRIIPTASLFGSARIRVQAADGSLTGATEFDLIVNAPADPPRITRDPIAQTVVAGDTARFVFEATGAQVSYAWRRGGAVVANGPELTIPNVSAQDEGEYVAEARNASGAATRPVSLNVVTLTRITQPLPESLSVTEGGVLDVAVAAEGDGLSYQWQRNGANVPNGTQARLQLTGMTSAQAGVYTVIVRGDGGTATSSGMVARVIAVPGLAKGLEDQTAPAGSTVEFVVLASGADMTYSWRKNGQPLPGEALPKLVLTDVQPDDEGTYQVEARNSAGGTISEATLTVLTAPSITAHPASRAVNEGQTAQFSVTATGRALTYQWKQDGVNLQNGPGVSGATEATLTLSNVPSERRGKYHVVVKNGGGEAESNEAELTVYIPITITRQPQPQTNALGRSVRFSVQASGTDPISYQWRHSGTNLPGATGPALELSNLTLAQGGLYSVVLTNFAGVVNSAGALLKVLAPPQIGAPPADVAVRPAETATFSVTATGDGPFRYQWLKNGANIPNATNATYRITNVRVTDAGNYSVVVANDIDAVTTAPGRLTVTLPILAVADNLADAPETSAAGIFSAGDNASATKETGEPDHAGQPGGTSVWFDWRAPGNGTVAIETTGSNFDTLLAAYRGAGFSAFSAVAGNDDFEGGFSNSRLEFNVAAGEVFHIAIDGFARAAGSIVVGIDFQPGVSPLPVIRQQPAPAFQSVAAGATVLFRVDAISLLGLPLSYQWFLNGQALASETRTNLVIASAQSTNAGSYFVRVSSGTGAAARVTMSSPVILEIGAATSQDKFGNAPGLADDPQSQQNEPRKPRPDGSGSMARGFSGSQVFNTFGASKEQGEQNHCDVLGGASMWFTYLAPANGVLSISTAGSSFDTVMAVYTGPGTDFASLISQGCDDNSGPNKTSAMLLPVTAGTTYYVAVDGVLGATGTVVINYQLAQTPVISQQPSPQTVTGGAAVSFTVAAANPLAAFSTNAAPQTYVWRKDGTPVPGATGPTLAFNAQVADNGDYTVVVSNFAGSVTSAPARLIVAAPAVITAQPASQTVRAGGTAILSVGASGTAPLRYQWQRDGANLPGQTNATLAVANAQATASYRALVSNAAGELASAVATVTVLEPLTVAPLSPAFVTNAVGGSVTLSVTANGSGPIGYQWRLNGVYIQGATSAQLTLSPLRLDHAGIYTVVVTNAVDAFFSSAVQLEVDAPIVIDAGPTPGAQSRAIGESAVFSVQATGAGPLLYQWMFNGGTLPSQTNQSLVLQNIQQGNEGDYSVLVRNMKNGRVSGSARLTVNLAPSITLQPVGTNVFEGAANLAFTVQATGTPPLTYQWLEDGAPITSPTATTPTLVIPLAAQSRSYSCVVRNDVGTVASAIARLEVTKYLKANRGADGTLSLGLNIPAGKTALIWTSTDLVNWTLLSQTPFPSSTTSVPLAPAGLNGYYYVEIR